MPILRFAKKFYPFDQVQHLGNLAVEINVSTMTSTPVDADPKGICYGLCCMWIREITKNRDYVIDAKEAFGGAKTQKSLTSRFDYSDCDNDLILQGLGQIANKQGIPHNNPNVINDALDHFAATDSANFLLLIFEKPSWAHAVAAKLNRSSTGGWLNWSYPCALFDPNIGQGMYNGHADLASDIRNLVEHYQATNVRAYTIQCDKIN
jgi:hypothetical protein